MDLKQMKNLADSLRLLSAKMVKEASSGHIGISLGMADVMAVLWYNFINFNPEYPEWPNRDRFIMSCGHGSALLYSILYSIGNLKLEDCMNFRQLHSKTPGHPEYDPEIGVEMTTGPLGQGIAWALGIARAATLDPDLDHYTYVFCSDGDLMEGIAYEAIALASEWKVKNFIVFWDDNQTTIDGKLNKSSQSSIINLFIQWNFIEIDGHNYEEIYSAIVRAQKSDRPACIRCKTIIGLGLNSAGSNICHGFPVKTELESFIDSIKLDLESIPKMWLRVKNRGQLAQKKWNEVNQYYSHPEIKINHVSNLLKSSTRKLVGQMMSHHITGSADLGESTCMNLSLNYTNFGVREHAMIAVAGGMALCGHIMPVATFLVFTDYCRPSIRLAALMRVSLKIVATHDSVFVGEDGPTHQPVEQLSSLRLIPNLHVWRPASILEMQAAIEDKNTSIIVCTRQEIDLIKSDTYNLDKVNKGAYIVHFVENPIATILATGSEVSLALSCLSDLNLRIQVVSMPCLELFEIQSKEYKEEILRGKIISIEAGRTTIWHKYADLPIGIDTFGVSAPMNKMPFLKKEDIVDEVKNFLNIA